MVPYLAILFCLPFGLPAQQASDPAPRARVVPETAEVDTAATVKDAKQVRVISDSPEVRAAFINYTDAIQRNFRQMMHETDQDWSSPLEVHVSGSSNDVVAGVTAVIPAEIKLHADGTFQFEVYVRQHNRYDETQVRQKFIELMLYEIMVRPFVGQPEAFQGKKLDPPYWVIRGIETLLQYRANGRPSELFAGIVSARKVLPLEEILTQEARESPDPVTDAIFSASAAALVATLIDQETGGGPENLKAYLADLTSPETQRSGDPGALLRRHFPRLRGSAGALEKWWSLQVASMGQLQALEFYSVGKTEALIDQALSISIPADPAKEQGKLRRLLPRASPRGPYLGRLHDYENFLDYEKAPQALQECRDNLRNLSFKAFPLYHGLILRYERAAARLMDEKPRGVKKELEQIDLERLGIREAMSRVNDYMNFMEATQAEGRSDAYRHYREMKLKLEREGVPPRDDRISKYLDSLEREFAAP